MSACAGLLDAATIVTAITNLGWIVSTDPARRSVRSAQILAKEHMHMSKLAPKSAAPAKPVKASPAAATQLSETELKEVAGGVTVRRAGEKPQEY